MRFHFGHHERGTGGVLTLSHPSHLVILDAHPGADHSSCPYLEDSIEPIPDPPTAAAAMNPKSRKQQPQSDEHPPNPADEDDDIPPVRLQSHWRQRSQDHDDESQDVRPRHRPFFRLGRHPRNRSSNNGEDHQSLSPPPSGRNSNKARIMSLRRPSMKRSVSLPHDLKVATVEATVIPSSCPPSTTHASKGHRRQVTFSCVQIREYSRILGDHPCCPSGPPLALGWDTEREDSLLLEEYEKKRDPLRRSKEDFRLGCQDRREILESLIVSPTSSDSEDCSSNGCSVYSRAEIRKAERRLNRERAENYRTVRKMNHRFFKPVEDEVKPQDETLDGE